MIKLKISPPLPAPTADDVRELEANLGISLPDSYVDFLQAGNAGLPTDENCYIDGYQSIPGRDFTIVLFYSVKPSTVSGVDSIEEGLRVYAGRVPDGFLPIASDNFGNLLLIGLIGPSRGKVFFWDHEDEGFDPPPPRMHNVYLLAENLDELMDRIKPKRTSYED